MQQQTQATPPAERMARHRAGVATQLREIRAQLDDLRRDVQARIDGLVEVVTEQQRGRPQ